ncbi:MAG: ThiF family adenylyltransferase [Phycisphaerae bacterium]
MPESDNERYLRQITCPQIGEEGQQKLLTSRVLLVGCGALGTTIAETLGRAGVGFLRIADRDFVELNNLQRQVLFDENDVKLRRPKAAAAAEKLSVMNSGITIEPHVVDVNHASLPSLADGIDLILDGTDNFETRYLINDFAVQHGMPWVYGAAVATTGLCMPVIPGETACLRCLFEDAPPPDMNPTCDTAGVLAMTVSLVANLQCVEAMKILTGNTDDLNRKLTHVDSWTPRIVSLKVERSQDKNGCPCCQRQEFPYLNGERESKGTTLCGRNAVQIQPPTLTRLKLTDLAEKIREQAGENLRINEYLLQADLEDVQLTLFHDGRAIIHGTEDIDRARSLVARYIGS